MAVTAVKLQLNHTRCTATQTNFRSWRVSSRLYYPTTLIEIAVYGVTKVDETFDRRVLAKDDSYLKRFLSAEEKHFDFSIEVSTVEAGSVNYGITSVQEEIRKLTSIVTTNKHYRNRSLTWMDAFSQFAKTTNINITEHISCLY